MINPLTNSEFQEMSGFNINELVESRLDDMVEQFTTLVEQGDYDTAKFLRNEGLCLAEYADSNNPFFFVNQAELGR
jgi:hypothetical protein